MSNLLFNKIIIANWKLMFNHIYYPQATFGYFIIYSGWVFIIIVSIYDLLKFTKRLINDSSLMQEMSKNALERSKFFDIENFKKSLQEYLPK